MTAEDPTAPAARPSAPAHPAASRPAASRPAASKRGGARRKPGSEPERFGLLGVASDYLIRTASVLGILAVFGLASAVDGTQASTAGASASTPAHASPQAGRR
jgi:hypothetical protein